MSDRLRVFSGSRCRQLAEDICCRLGIELGDALVGAFGDGEVKIEIYENVRGMDTFVVNSTCPPTNDNLVELLLMIDALKRASAERITAVIPYFGYARQDRKDKSRVPISAKLVANMLSTAGADRVIALDLHAAQVQGFFDIPVDHLYAGPVLIQYFKELNIQHLTIVAPDVGSSKLSRWYGDRLNAKLAIVDKQRINDKQSKVMNLIGDVEGRNVLIIDDMIAGAGTITEATQAVKAAGANDIYLAATHPVLCGSAMELLDKAPIKELVITDSIPLPPDKHRSYITLLSVAPLLAEAIQRIHYAESVSKLFEVCPEAHANPQSV